MKNKKIFFPNLDGLRFIAFLMVFCWHTLRLPFEMMNVKNYWLQKIFYLFISGKTGVSIFFVLSGFLITYLILAETALNGRLNVLKFYMRRSLRIWPLYFLILILIFGVFHGAMNALHLNWQQYDMRPVFYFLFLSNFDVLHIYLIKGTDLLASTITWSVAIEEQFYVVWPLLFAFIPAKLYKFIFPFLLILCYTWRSLHAQNEAVLYFHSLSVIGDLALGGWIGWLSFTNEKFVLFFKNQPNKFRAAAYLGFLIFLYFFQFIDNGFTHVSGRLFQTIFFCYIILDQNFSTQQAFKFSNSRFITFWGKYTYGLYLWHPLVLLGFTIVVNKGFHFSLHNIRTHLILAPITFIGCLTISYLSYHYFEVYFLNFKKKFAFINKN